MAGFLGRVESRIDYCLVPDPGTTDEGGGLVEADGLPGDGGQDAAAGEVCTGKWNMSARGPPDKKDKDRWWHTERPRWREVRTS